MDGERPEGLPEDLRDWLDERAAETGRNREELLARAVAAYRLATEAEAEAEARAGNGPGSEPGPGSDPGDGSAPESGDGTGEGPLAALSALDGAGRAGDPAVDPQRVEELAGRVESIRERTEELSAAVDDLDAELATAVEDVRDRVLEVLAEAESKADADHGHPDLADRVEAAERAAATATADLSAVEDRLAGLGDDAAANAEALADVEGKLTTVARAVVRLRDRVASLEGEDARRTAVESIARAAADHGVRRAACDDCGRTVDVGLLTEPRCPHCGRHAKTVEPATGFFGSDRLVTGDPPAIEGDSSADDGGDVSLLAPDAADGTVGSDRDGDGDGNDPATGRDGADD